MDISFESNLREWTADMTAFERQQLPFATVMALTATAQDVRAEHKSLLPVIFDRPTRFTMNSLQVTPATKFKLTAQVYFKYPHRGKHYLLPQVEGGSRPVKRFEHLLIQRGLMQHGEYAVPAKGAKLDGFGNLSAGTITQILSQLSASSDAMQWETERSRKRNGKRRARYFVTPPDSRLPRGIWRQRGKAIEPVILFGSGVGYSSRYDFDGISLRSASVRFPLNFDIALYRAMGSARRV